MNSVTFDAECDQALSSRVGLVGRKSMKQSWDVFLRWATLLRYESLRNLASTLVPLYADAFLVPDSALKILVGGDINFDPEIRMMWNLGVYRLREKAAKGSLVTRIKRKLWQIFSRHFFSTKFFNTGIYYSSFDEFSIKKPENEEILHLDSFNQRSKQFEIDFSSTPRNYAYPFEKIASFLRSKDLVFVNLETPLTTNCRVNGLFMSDSRYAQALRDAGVSFVTLANNHIFDAGEKGFLDTIHHLKSANISYTGVGENLEDAR